MGPFEMITMVVMTGCGTGLLITMVGGWVSVQKAKAARGSDALAGELRALREEVRLLREQNADMMLTYDTTMQRLAAMAAPPVRQERVIEVGQREG